MPREEMIKGSRVRERAKMRMGISRKIKTR
jgi:hypothetical protein